MKRILIFTAGFGEGHNSAARNISSAIEELADDTAEVEILDLFDTCYGSFNDLLKQAYFTAIAHTPALWRGLYQLADNTNLVPGTLAALGRMQKALEDLLFQTEPDAVVSCYPLYNNLIDEIYSQGRQRRFAQFTVITDSISVNSLWFRCHSDFFLVPNEPTAQVLRNGRIPEEKIKVFGFPVASDFAEQKKNNHRHPIDEKNPPRILALFNSRKKKALKLAQHLVERTQWRSTICTGRDELLRQELMEMCAGAGHVKVLGWTNQMPRLLLTHHFVITKAGGATVQEAIAAECPLIINKIIPGQEEGNCQLIVQANAGAFAEKPKAIIAQIDRALENDALLWRQWNENIKSIGRADGAIKIAELVLEHAALENVPLTLEPLSHRVLPPTRARTEAAKHLLLCDFHSHTTFSDGKLTVPELIDFYGQRGFDCLCVTDHVCDPGKLLGKLCQFSGLVIPPEETAIYFETLEKEKIRAWKKYNMILMAGLEFNKDGYTSKTSTHLLGIDLKEPIDPSLDLKETINRIHAQEGLAVASHPHETKSVWGKDTLYLWEHQDEFAPLLDAWEIANRDDIFNPVGLKRLPFLGSSDFHKPKHIHSWKTVLCCEKDSVAIKECIRLNRDVALTLYRDHRFGAAEKILEKSLEKID